MKSLCRNLWRIGASFSALVWATSAFAQSEAAVAARKWREGHELPIVQEFSKLLEIPNIARDLPNIRRNAALLREMLERRGVKTQLLEVPDVPPVLLPLMIPIEVISFLSRPLSLSVRLFANMLAGHIALKIFAGFVASLLAAGVWGILSPLPLLLTIALTALELLVAVLQAYVFAVLTCVYLTDAVHGAHH